MTLLLSQCQVAIGVFGNYHQTLNVQGLEADYLGMPSMPLASKHRARVSSSSMTL